MQHHEIWDLIDISQYTKTPRWRAATGLTWSALTWKSPSGYVPATPWRAAPDELPLMPNACLVTQLDSTRQILSSRDPFGIKYRSTIDINLYKLRDITIYVKVQNPL